MGRRSFACGRPGRSVRLAHSPSRVRDRGVAQTWPLRRRRARHLWRSSHHPHQRVRWQRPNSGRQRSPGDWPAAASGSGTPACRAPGITGFYGSRIVTPPSRASTASRGSGSGVAHRWGRTPSCCSGHGTSYRWRRSGSSGSGSAASHGCGGTAARGPVGPPHAGRDDCRGARPRLDRTAPGHPDRPQPDLTATARRRGIRPRRPAYPARCRPAPSPWLPRRS